MLNNYNLNFKIMTTTIETSIIQHAIDRLADGSLEDIYSDDLHNYLFNEDYFITYYSRAEQWLKDNDLSIWEVMSYCKEQEQDVNQFPTTHAGVKPHEGISAQINEMNLSAVSYFYDTRLALILSGQYIGFLPEFYAEVTSDSKLERSVAWQKLFYSTLPFYLGVLVFCVCAREYIILLFSSSEYLSATPFLVGGAFFHFFRKMTATFALIAHGEMKTKALIFPYFVGALGSSVGVFLGFSLFEVEPTIILPISGLLMLIAMVVKTRNMITEEFSLKGFLSAVKDLARLQ